MSICTVAERGTNGETSQPIVSVCMITYQHAPYIRQALDSVLMQQTDFAVEICIGEDQSIDGTREICQEYAAKHPNVIHLFLRDRADPVRLKYRAPFAHNSIETLKACRGKYVALLEGDDYWTSPHKLRKQLDFLKAHPDYSICFHNAIIVVEGDNRAPLEFCPPDQKKTSTIEDLILSDFIPTCSIMYTRVKLSGFPDFVDQLGQTDWITAILLAQHGFIGYLSEIMAAYRVHSGGAWSSLSRTARNEDIVQFYEIINPYLQFKFDWTIRKLLADLHYDLARQYSNQGDSVSARTNLLKCLMDLRHGLISLRFRIIKVVLRLYLPALCEFLSRTRNVFKCKDY